MKNPQLKKAFATDEYTPHMVNELRKCKADPIYFMRNYIKIQHPTRGTINFNLFEYQERFVKTMHENRFVLTLQPRQCGKTLTVAMYLLWYACFTDDVTVLIASKNQSHALEIAARVRFAYEELPNWLKPGLKYFNRHNVELDNGSRIVSEATTEKTGRGLSISKLYLDELAFISPRIQELMWASLAPTLSTGGSAIISSTPNGDTELFATLWRRAMSGIQDELGTNFVPFQVHWREHPERDDKYWDTMVNMLGLLKTRQEVGCVAGDTLITTRNKLTGFVQHGTIEDVAKELLAHAQNELPNDLDTSSWEDSARRARAIVRDPSHQRQSFGRSSREPRVHPCAAALRTALGDGRSVRGDVDRSQTWQDTTRAERHSAWWETLARNLQEDLGGEASTTRSRIDTVVQGQEAHNRDSSSMERSTPWEKILIEALTRASARDQDDLLNKTRSSNVEARKHVRASACKASPSYEVPTTVDAVHSQHSDRQKLVILIPNTLLEILTPSGFQNFAGVRVQQSELIKISTNTSNIKCSIDHKFSKQVVHDLSVGDELDGQTIEHLEALGASLVYDPVDVQGGHLYVTNGLISHNCEFLSSDAMLISSMKLQQIAGKMIHHEDMGFKFWVPDEQLGGAGKTYLVSIDPATGNGKDFSAIEVFDFPQLNQVAEWRSNEINVPLLYAKVKWILNKLSAPVNRGRADVLWTFERNGIGEAMSALYFNDEKQPEHPELYCDVPGKLGVYTTGKTKILACLQTKSMIEKVTNGYKLASEVLLFELKNYIAKGGSYEAKSGATDDCVSALLGITRLIKRLAEYNDDAFKQVNEYVDPDDSVDQFGDEPIPFVV